MVMVSGSYVQRAVMKKLIVLFTVLFLFSCVQRPAPVATHTGERLAIAIQYVAVPSMKVLAAPNDNAELKTQYGYKETVSILAKQGDWVEVRTVDGSGWSHANELMGADEATKLANDKTPRFATPPPAVPAPGARGEIDFNAKVNTDGEVIDVQIVKNTTGIKSLADQNAQALKSARFYPLVDKGQRMTFVYEHRVYY